MVQYIHTPVPPNTIRILHLHPGPPDSPLRGRLAHYPLPQLATTTTNTVNDLPASDYDCVSYAWGSGEKPFTIILSDNRPLPITATLNSLLRRLRKQFSDNGDNGTQPLSVWADAICINQDDAIEKGEQVGLMPEIYRGARRVVVDLGEEGDDGDLDDALWLMSSWWKKNIWYGTVFEILGSNTVLTPREAGMLLGFEVPCDGEREALEGVELPEWWDPRWDVVARFFGRPWFERLWVVQEFVLAREVVMICGEREIAWREVVAATLNTPDGVLPVRGESTMTIFQRVTFQLRAYQRQVKVLLQTAEGQEILRIRKQSPGGDYALDLYTLLGMFQMSKVTRRRDRYFALMGIAEDVKGDEPELRPDYVSPIETVVSRVGRWLWNNGHGSAILLTGGLLQESELKIPSWVPDFSTSSCSRLLSSLYAGSEQYNAGGNRAFHFTITSGIDHLVTLSAIPVDVVDREPIAEIPSQATFLGILGSPSDDTEGNDSWNMQLLLRYVALNLRVIFDDIASNSPAPVELSDHAVSSALLFGAEWDLETMTDKERAIGFRRISWLVAHGDMAHEMGDGLFEVFDRSLEREFSATADELKNCQASFLDLVTRTHPNRRLTRTRRGRAASLPSCFKRGDEIWVVRGVALPLLLRRSTEYHGCYELVGSCYVHGIMDGEALEEGPRFEQLTLC